MARFTASIVFSALLCITVWAKNIPEPLPDEVTLIIPNGTVVAGSYVHFGFFVPIMEGVTWSYIMSLTYPSNITEEISFIESSPNCADPSNLFDSKSQQPEAKMQMRLVDIGNYTVTLNATINFYSDVDLSKNPPMCQGNMTTETSILTRPLAVVPAGPGVSQTDSQGVITRTNDPLTVSTIDHVSFTTLNSLPFIEGPTNVVNATFSVEPTGTMYVSVSSAQRGTDIRRAAWVGTCLVVTMIGGFGLLATI